MRLLVVEIAGSSVLSYLYGLTQSGWQSPSHNPDALRFKDALCLLFGLKGDVDYAFAPLDGAEPRFSYHAPKGAVVIQIHMSKCY